MYTTRELYEILPGMGEGAAKELIVDCGHQYKVYSIDGVRQEWTYKDYSVEDNVIVLEIIASTILNVR